MQSPIDVRRDDAVIRITLNRPDRRNAMTRAVLEELWSVVSATASDRHVRALVLAATGPVFCAGMDLAEMQARSADPLAAEQYFRDSQIYAQIVQGLFELPFPTMALVQGPVLAGGVGLILACDLIICAESVYYALPEPARGIVAAMVTPLLTARVGYGHAAGLLLSGERLDAKVAMHCGLCYDTVQVSQLEERGERLLHSILKNSPLALSKTKEFLRQCAAADLHGQLAAAIRISAEARESSDAREGLQAFLEKRNPSWQKTT